MLKQLLYDLARKTLSQRTRLMLKTISDRYVERAIRRLDATLRGTVSLGDLQTVVHDAVPAQVRCLTIHSALSPFKHLYAGEFTDLFTLFDRFLECGVTLLFPTFPRIMVPWKDYFNENPVFDVKQTKSGMGALTEYMRKRSDAHRSLHPTKSVVCIGPLAEELTGEHHLEGRVEHAVSPFAKMLAYPSGILGVGVEYYRSISHIHVVEEIMGDNFPVRLKGDETSPVTLVDDQQRTRTFSVSHPHPAGYPCQATLIRKYHMDGGLKTWTYRTVPFWYVDANRLVKEMHAAALQGLTVYGDVRRADFPHALRQKGQESERIPEIAAAAQPTPPLHGGAAAEKTAATGEIDAHEPHGTIPR